MKLYLITEEMSCGYYEDIYHNTGVYGVYTNKNEAEKAFNYINDRIKNHFQEDLEKYIKIDKYVKNESRKRLRELYSESYSPSFATFTASSYLNMLDKEEDMQHQVYEELPEEDRIFMQRCLSDYFELKRARHIDYDTYELEAKLIEVESDRFGEVSI